MLRWIYSGGYSHRNARANLDLLGQPNSLLAPVLAARGQRHQGPQPRPRQRILAPAHRPGAVGARLSAVVTLILHPRLVHLTTLQTIMRQGEILRQSKTASLDPGTEGLAPAYRPGGEGSSPLSDT